MLNYMSNPCDLTHCGHRIMCRITEVVGISSCSNMVTALMRWPDWGESALHSELRTPLYVPNTEELTD